MKLIDAVKEKGNPYWIPNCSRDDLPGFFKEMGYKTGLEVGVGYGANLKKCCEAGFTMYGVDPWANYINYRYLRPGRVGSVLKTADDLYNFAVKDLSPYPNCTIIRKTSIDAVEDFPDRSLDFIYIDGNHSFGYVAMDLMKWCAKVKKRGIIAGHDFYTLKGSRSNRMVEFVVEAFVKSYDIDNWYVLGRKNPDPEEKNDGALSFMFFKHW